MYSFINLWCGIDAGALEPCLWFPWSLCESGVFPSRQALETICNILIMWSSWWRTRPRVCVHLLTSCSRASHLCHKTPTKRRICKDGECIHMQWCISLYINTRTHALRARQKERNWKQCMMNWRVSLFLPTLSTCRTLFALGPLLLILSSLSCSLGQVTGWKHRACLLQRKETGTLKRSQREKSEEKGNKLIIWGSSSSGRLYAQSCLGELELKLEWKEGEGWEEKKKTAGSVREGWLSVAENEKD